MEARERQHEQERSCAAPHGAPSTASSAVPSMRAAGAGLAPPPAVAGPDGCGGSSANGGAGGGVAGGRPMPRRLTTLLRQKSGVRNGSNVHFNQPAWFAELSDGPILTAASAATRLETTTRRQSAQGPGCRVQGTHPAPTTRRQSANTIPPFRAAPALSGGPAPSPAPSPPPPKDVARPSPTAGCSAGRVQGRGYSIGLGSAPQGGQRVTRFTDDSASMGFIR